MDTIFLIVSQNKFITCPILLIKFSTTSLLQYIYIYMHIYKLNFLLAIEKNNFYVLRKKICSYIYFFQATKHRTKLPI